MKTIFVSSTFRDFQQERDVLHDRVLPRLNEKAKTYGESVSFCDLRWGVDTSKEGNEEESSAKVLSVCMNEIDRSRPFMLVLLGERYGFMPGREAIAREGRRKSMELADLEISVTALEIEYGALQSQRSLEHTWFYFRELEAEGELPPEYLPESQAHQEKLAAMKARIRHLAGDHVRFYKARWGNDQVEGLEEFARFAEQDLQAQMEAEWKTYESLDPYERDAKSQWNYLGEKARSFAVFESFAQQTIKRIGEDGAAYTAVTGPAGSGKSTMFAKICQTMRDQGWQVLPFCGGSTSLATDAFSIQKSIIWQLESRLGLPHFEEMEQEKREKQAQGMEMESSEGTVSAGFTPLQWRARLNELCLQAAKQAPVLLAVDALDQLQESEMRDTLEFLPMVSLDGVRVFVTCLEEHALPGNAARISMPRMDGAERQQVVKSTLALLGKELSEPVTAAVTAKRQGDNPLYLYLAVSRLCLMNAADFRAIRDRGDGMEAIMAQQLEMVAAMPDQLEGLGVNLIDAVGERISPKMVEAACRYLALSRHGLRLSDLKSLLGNENVAFSELEFAQLVNYMNELFLLRADGRYDFLHKSLRQGLLSRMAEAGTDFRAEHQKIVDHLFTLPDDDPVSIQDCTWESMEADNKEAFVIWMTHVWGREDEEPGFAAGRDVAAWCRSDDGQWVSACLRDLINRNFANTEEDPDGKYKAMAQLCFLVLSAFLPAFGQSLADHRRKRKLMKAAVDCAEEGLKEEKHSSLENVITLCYPEYGALLMESDLAEERKQAIPVLRRGYDLAKAQFAETGSKHTELRLSQLAFSQARACCAEGSRESYIEAIRLGELALSHLEHVRGQVHEWGELVMECNIKSILSMASTCLNEKKYLEKGYTYTTQLIQLMGGAVEKKRTAFNIVNLARVYGNLCQVLVGLADQGDRERLPEALRAAQTMLELMMESDRMKSTPESRSGIANAWNHLFGVYNQREDAESREKALACAKKSTEIYETMSKELGTPEALHSAVNCMGLVGDAYRELGKKQEALNAYLLAAEKAEKLAAWVPVAKYFRILRSLLGKAAKRCVEIGDRDHLYQAYDLSMREGAVSRRLITEFVGEEDREAWEYHLECFQKMTKAFADLTEDEDKVKSYLCGVYLLENTQDEALKKQLLNEMFTLCEIRRQAMIEEVQQVDDPQRQAELWENALTWVERKREIFFPIPEEQRGDWERGIIAGTYRDLAGIALTSGMGNLTEALQTLHLGLEEMKKMQEREVNICRLRWEMCYLGKTAAEQLAPEAGRNDPESLFFTREESTALEVLTEKWGEVEQLPRQNALYYQLWDYYDDQEDWEQAADWSRREVSSGEKILAMGMEADGSPEKFGELASDLSSSCYRAAKTLRKVGTPEALEEALCYAARDVELSSRLLQKADFESVGNVAISLCQQGRILLALKDRAQETIAAFEQELSLRGLRSSMDPCPDTWEDEALCCYRLSGLHRELGGSEHLALARSYSARDLALAEKLVEAEPKPSRKRDLCSSLIRARLVEEALGEKERAIEMQKRILLLRQEVLAEEPNEKHQQHLSDAEEVMARLLDEEN